VDITDDGFDHFAFIEALHPDYHYSLPIPS